MNRFEQKNNTSERHPAVKIIESILSEDNPKNEELRDVIQNAESYAEIKQYISREKTIQGANGEKFYAQNLNPWIDMMRQQFPEISQLRNTQMYQEMVGGAVEMGSETQSSSVVENADWLNGQTNETVAEDNIATAEIKNPFQSVQGTTGYKTLEDAKAAYAKRKGSGSASGALDKSRYGKNGGNSAESYLNK
jgi:hypothetical protein